MFFHIPLALSHLLLNSLVVPKLKAKLVPSSKIMELSYFPWEICHFLENCFRSGWRKQNCYKEGTAYQKIDSEQD